MHEASAKTNLKIAVIDKKDLRDYENKDMVKEDVSNLLGLDVSKDLSPQLGARGMLLDLPHDEDGGRELIIPMALVDKVSLKPERRENMKNYVDMGSTTTIASQGSQDLSSFTNLTIEPRLGTENQQNKPKTTNDVGQSKGVKR